MNSTTLKKTQQQTQASRGAGWGSRPQEAAITIATPPIRLAAGEEDRRRVVQAHLDYGEGRSQKRTSKAKASTTKRRLPKIRKISF